ncbi:MAG: glycosyltransferase [Solirubrobacteraceae bacterium]
MAATPRILHVYKDVHPDVPGGIERHVDLLRTDVPDVRSDVLVARRGCAPTRVRQNGGEFEIAVWQVGRLLSSPLTTGYGRWARRLEPDLVHVHMPNPVGELAVLGLDRHVPVVATYHADVVRQAWLLGAYGRLLRAILDRADVVICGTEGLRRTSPFLAGRIGVRVIPYGVDACRFASTPLRTARARPVVIATGRLVYYKGFARLISLAKHLPADVVIVGTGPLEARLRRQAAGMPNVHLTGAVDDAELALRLADADIFVLPSTNRAESFGLVTIEAQAAGLPAVVADVGTGTVEAVEHGVTGLVVPSDDDAALLAALTFLVDNPARRLAMGAAARHRAVALFSADRVAADHAAVYAEVLDARRRLADDPTIESPHTRQRADNPG